MSAAPSTCPYGDVDRIAKLVPTTIGVTLDDALKDSPQLQEAYQGNPQIRELIDTAKKLEDLIRGAGVHASAVVIAPRPLTELVRSPGPRTTKSSPPMT